jgi:hypothetical protein
VQVEVAEEVVAFLRVERLVGKEREREAFSDALGQITGRNQWMM